MKNPMLKAKQKIIRKVYNNPATLRCVCKTKNYNSETGEITDTEHSYDLTIYLAKPQKYNAFVVDGKNYCREDITTVVSALEVTNAISGTAGLSSVRDTNSSGCGIDVKTDFILFGGDKFKIVAIDHKDVYAGIPASLSIQMRKI